MTVKKKVSRPVLDSAFCDCFFGQLGNFLHYMATFVSGFVVGFTAAWQLALVTLAVVPLIAVIGGIHATTLSKLSAKSQDALSEAGNIAEQVKYS